jgi:ligand-binding sensor domain-containing protein/two-component sensor histidine kinase
VKANVSFGEKKPPFSDAFGRLVCWLFVLVGQVAAQQSDVKFDCLTLDQGLSQTTVLAIAQDQTGYLWFGTVDGLNKFDGYNFTIYENNPLDPNSISDDWILSLLVDREDVLWVGTLRGVLNRFDPGADSFEHFRPEPGAIRAEADRQMLSELPAIFSFLQPGSIKTIFEDRQGTLWLGTSGAGLFTFDRSTQQISACDWYNDSASRAGRNILAVCETQTREETALWVATFGGGLIKIVNQKIVKIFLPGPENNLSDHRITTLLADSLAGAPVIWVGTVGGGLNRFEIQTERFTVFRHDPRHPSGLSEDFILTILKNDPDFLWIGTPNRGLNRLQISRREFTHFQYDPANPAGLGSNTILSLCQDHTGIIWIGTDLGNGIYKVAHRRVKFQRYSRQLPEAASLSDHVIFALFEDSKQELWVGTFKGGITKFNARRDQVTLYQHRPDDPNSLSDNHIRCFFEDRQGTMWIGTFAGGLDAFNARTRRFTHHRHRPDDSTSMSTNQVRAIFEDHQGRMWVATFGGGLDLFDRKSGKFRHFRHDPTNANSLSDDRVYTIIEPNPGVLWLTAFDGGIVKFEVATEKFTRYQRDPAKLNSLNENRVFCLLPDPNLPDVFWAGTSGGGLNRFDTRTASVTHFTQKDGLPNNVVYGVLADDQGCLWMSTNKGLAKFDLQTQAFTNYDQTDGLQSNEFNSGAFFKSARGELFFGGINGFNSFFPEQIRVNSQPPPVVITSFKIFDKDKSDLLPRLSETQPVNLSYKDNFFSFEFAALDFTKLSKNQYAYQLEGLSATWIPCGTRRFVNFTNLDPGDYIFRVKGANSDGIWNNQGTFIKLKITPPVWKTWWFYLGVVATTFVSIFGLYRYRLRIHVKREVELERVRLFENERVRKMVAADFHDELGQKLTRISLFSEIVKRKLAATSPENLEYMEKISGVATELSRSTRDFIWTLDPAQDSLYDIAIYLKDFGDEIFDKTGVTFRVAGISRELEGIKLPVKWRRHLTLIFKEAMNNVLKHARARNVLFVVALEMPKVKISLQDDGIGCHPAETSSGRGLPNMRHRATVIESELQIISQNSSGTVIELVSEIPQKGY